MQNPQLPNPLLILLAFLVLFTFYAMSAHAENAPQNVTVVNQKDCAGNFMPADMPVTVTTAASGVGFVRTIVETQGNGVTYTQTVDTSVSNVTSISCSLHN